MFAFLVSLLPHFGQGGRLGPNLIPPSVSNASNVCPHCLHLNVALPLKCSIFVFSFLVIPYYIYTLKRRLRADILQRRSWENLENGIWQKSAHIRRGNNCTTFSVFSSVQQRTGKFSGSRLVRMKHGASLFSMSMKRNKIRIYLQRYRIFPNWQSKKRKKLHSSVKNPSLLPK